eukprot:TRINITY_DN1998_c0_g1_i1.p1 TRINITY_DN1998_c0_g1~~TRINITY_DN1998_c0_g1_i1.p1  ORF type:complete len:1099 (-),score=191.89 TRINITY_DN1998_c0_g1_i1:76-3336(-)
MDHPFAKMFGFPSGPFRAPMARHMSDIGEKATRSILKQAMCDYSVVFVFLTTEWCGPSKQMKPIFHKLSERYKSCGFVTIDVDDDKELASQFSVRAIPKFVTLIGKKVQESVEGADVDALCAMVAKWAKQSPAAPAAPAEASGRVSNVRKNSELQLLCQKNKVVFLFFTAHWCGPSRDITPLFAQLSDRYPKASFVKIDVDSAAKLAACYDVDSMPTFIVLVDSVVKARFEGAHEGKLRTMVDKYAAFAAATAVPSGGPRPRPSVPAAKTEHTPSPTSLPSTGTGGGGGEQRRLWKFNSAEGFHSRVSGFVKAVLVLVRDPKSMLITELQSLANTHHSIEFGYTVFADSQGWTSLLGISSEDLPCVKCFLGGKMSRSMSINAMQLGELATRIGQLAKMEVKLGDPGKRSPADSVAAEAAKVPAAAKAMSHGAAGVSTAFQTVPTTSTTTATTAPLQPSATPATVQPTTDPSYLSSPDRSGAGPAPLPTSTGPPSAIDSVGSAAKSGEISAASTTSSGDLLRSQSSHHSQRSFDSAENQAALSGVMRFHYQTIVKATNNFHDDLLLGRGGFGHVYAAELAGAQCAVKRLDVQGQQSVTELMAELQALSMFRHDNIVILRGVCTDGPSPCIIYERCLGGGLASIQKSSLLWDTRVSIAADIASALAYLQMAQKPLLHLDIKSSNILLTAPPGPGERPRAKLSDFGLARTLQTAESMAHLTLTSAKGTMAYMDPDVATGRASAASDIFSFGVVLLELATGRSPALLKQGIMEEMVSGKTKLELLDPLAKWSAGIGEQIGQQLFDLGMQCTISAAEKRPKIAAVYSTLDALRKKLPLLLSTPAHHDSDDDTCAVHPPSCEYSRLCIKLMQDALPEAFQFVSQPLHVVCFCDSCACEHGQADAEHMRGSPPKKYSLPLGWTKVKLSLDVQYAQAMRVFEDWHVAYHGTTREVVPSVLRTRQLALPGDTVYGGYKVEIRPGHIKKTFDRAGADGATEHFDPGQLFLSPSMVYSGHNVYAKPFLSQDTVTGQTYKMQVAFQLRVRPGSYQVGRETIGAKKELDRVIPNSEIEWYTRERGAQMIIGLLLRAVPA